MTTELAAMYRDFDRWMPGVFDSSPINVHYGVPYVSDSESDHVLPALIESAVLDELERREMVWMHCLVQGDPTLILHAYRTPQWVGTGPTRLHRLHAACLAAFGTEARP